MTLTDLTGIGSLVGVSIIVWKTIIGQGKAKERGESQTKTLEKLENKLEAYAMQEAKCKLERSTIEAILNTKVEDIRGDISEIKNHKR